MSLLRVGAFVKCLNRRRLFEKYPIGVFFENCCQFRVPARKWAVRRMSETPVCLQRRNVSLVIPKKQETKKLVLEQFQLVDVLEARIQQLQSDIILDVQHAEVQFVKAPPRGKGVSIGMGPRNKPHEKKKNPKFEQTVTSTPSGAQLSRWKEKLAQEKEKMLMTQQNLLQSSPKIGVKKGRKKCKGTKSDIMPSGATLKTISTAVKKKKPQQTKPADKLIPAVPSPVPAVAAAATASIVQKVSKRKQKDPKLDEQAKIKSQAKEKELAEVKEVEMRLKEKFGDWTSSSNPEHLLENSDADPWKIIPLSIYSYLEACAFQGDIQRAHQYLLSQHRLLNRRKLLNTQIYNVLMRVYAKKGTLHRIGSIFILLEDAGLKPNAESYVAALECMGRSEICSPKVISRCLTQMEQNGLSMDDLFRQCVFRQDERDMLLKAIHVIHPDYQPSISPEKNQEYSVLVKDFYTQRENHAYHKLDFAQDELQERFKRQLSIEQACSVTIDSVEASKPVTPKMEKMRALLAEQRAQWQKVLLQALRDGKLILAHTNTKSSKLNLYPYLCLLEDREYVDIMIQSLSNLSINGESMKVLARQLGHRVFTQYCVRQKVQNKMVEKLATIYNLYTDLLAKDTKVYSVLPREQWCQLEMEHSSGPTLMGGEISWPYTVTSELGMYLVDLMVKNLKINNNILNPTFEGKLIPIIYHMYTFRSIKQIIFIKPHPILTQMQQDAVETKLTFDSYVLPMVCPPVPWTAFNFGAYLLAPTKLMRTMTGVTQHDELLEKCQKLQPVLDSLNLLGNCAWRINKSLLDIIISIFNDRGSDELDIPPPMSEAPKILRANTNDPNYTARQIAELKKEAMNAKKKCYEMHSLRMDALYKLSIAYHMRDEVFWFPHNMDFRGRTYPCPPYFNHLGSDVTRAILVFAEGKPLGPKGLDWLKIHLVNLTGLKKRSSLQQRLEYANTVMDDILDSADKPLTGNKWWMKADEPWQTLACCMEIANAVRAPDPAKFISHFPVHQDGSCNGLQHYAALGRDVIGATSVNLMPCDVPQDVYTAVAQQVEAFRVQDAESGLPIAKMLEGFISRKVVKQTVMTVVYGVTVFGGRLQIEKRLKEIDEFPKDYVWDASHYLVRKVFSTLKEMFTGTREIQDWLTESARFISKAGHTVQWVTPLGLPVIQPYHRSCHQVLSSSAPNTRATSHDIKMKPHTVKQKNAFPPNFIHSLDSTHMMLTALHCYSAGLTFVSVHDCFWTHAITVDTMNKVCRDQFVALHSQPILQDLSDFLVHKYCIELPSNFSKNKKDEYRKLLSQVPQTGDFDLEHVKESTYFFN